MARLQLACLLLVAVASLHATEREGSQSESKERELVWRLIGRPRARYSQYDTRVRPINNTNEAVVVRFSVEPIKLDPFEGDSDVLSSHLFIQMTWKDVRLVWSPEEFNGQSKVRLPIDNLWRPDIALYNSVDGFEVTHVTRGQGVVESNGDVLFVPSVAVKSHCHRPNPDSATQSCKMKWGSWAYESDGIDLQLGQEEVMLGDLVPSRCWRLDSANAVRNSFQYPALTSSYLSIDYSFNFTNTCA